MDDSTEDLVTLKIFSSDREWVKDEQRRIEKAEGSAPTQAVLFQRMRAAYEHAPMTLPEELMVPDAYRAAMRGLAKILRSRERDLADWISGNVRTFLETLENRETIRDRRKR